MAGIGDSGDDRTGVVYQLEEARCRHEQPDRPPEHARPDNSRDAKAAKQRKPFSEVSIAEQLFGRSEEPDRPRTRDEVPDDPEQPTVTASPGTEPAEPPRADKVLRDLQALHERSAPAGPPSAPRGTADLTARLPARQHRSTGPHPDPRPRSRLTRVRGAFAVLAVLVTVLAIVGASALNRPAAKVAWVTRHTTRHPQALAALLPPLLSSTTALSSARADLPIKRSATNQRRRRATPRRAPRHASATRSKFIEAPAKTVSVATPRTTAQPSEQAAQPTYTSPVTDTTASGVTTPTSPSSASSSVKSPAPDRSVNASGATASGPPAPGGPPPP